MANNKPTNHLIAYVDFLGTKEIITKDVKNEHLQFLSCIYQRILNQINKKNTESMKFIKKIKMKIFSDNILIATSANLTKMQLNYVLGDFIELVGKLQVSAMLNGFLVRGGITLDKIFINDTFVYGKGLLEVLQLEEKVAHYPRIILHSSLEEICKNYFDANYYTLKDFDNMRYVNYNKFAINQGYLSQLYEKLYQLKQRSSLDYNKISKLNWAINSYNKFIIDNDLTNPLINPIE